MPNTIIYGYYSGVYIARNVDATTSTTNATTTSGGVTTNTGTCTTVTNSGYGFYPGTSVLATGSGTCAVPGGSSNSADRYIYEPTIGYPPIPVEERELRRHPAHDSILIQLPCGVVCCARHSGHCPPVHGVHRPSLRFAVARAANQRIETRLQGSRFSLPWIFCLEGTLALPIRTARRTRARSYAASGS